ncbi:MAG: L,D-transpeptidase family protein [Flavobacteriales bacterium]
MLTLVMCISIWCALNAPPGQGLIDLLLEYMEARYPAQDLSPDLLYVSVQHQTMYHVRDRKLVGTYDVATASRGPGCERDSYCTPTGLHRICSKHGDDVPELGILRDREFTGTFADPDFAGVDKDWITSRVLWREGREEGVNRGGAVDSRERMIYIHGTANERSVGTPSSMGCIRMRNDDIISLYDLVPVGTLVVILDN